MTRTSRLNLCGNGRSPAHGTISPLLATAKEEHNAAASRQSSRSAPPAAKACIASGLHLRSAGGRREFPWRPRQSQSRCSDWVQVVRVGASLRGRLQVPSLHLNVPPGTRLVMAATVVVSVRVSARVARADGRTRIRPCGRGLAESRMDSVLSVTVVALASRLPLGAGAQLKLPMNLKPASSSFSVNLPPHWQTQSQARAPPGAAAAAAAAVHKPSLSARSALPAPVTAGPAPVTVTASGGPPAARRRVTSRLQPCRARRRNRFGGLSHDSAYRRPHGKMSQLRAG
jgi:hypothetical protein